jgi:predicted 3-demethylubiquinone-9 3-methyltransferase (glyoxalase superfamily)
MPEIVPHLWFDKEAAEAARLYTSVFERSSILSQAILSETPSGTVETLTISLQGQEFILLSAGPLFKLNASVSFLVACATKEEVDRIWKGLGAGSSELMPLGAYPFSERYGWLADRFGVNWQVMFMGGRPMGQKFTPTLMFTDDCRGKAGEAVRFYASVFGGSKVGDIEKYGPGAEPNAPDAVKHAAFTLEGLDFAAMDSGFDHGFGFNEAISFMVHCGSQEEIDHYWDRLSAVPEAERCGWLKDRYGLSWQIVPTLLGELMGKGDDAARGRVTQAFLKMKKFDLEGLRKAFAAP